MRWIFLAPFVVLSSFCLGQSGPCTDSTAISYHGHTYELVEIGNHCWFKENLRTTQWRNGEDLQVIEDNNAWSSTNDAGTCVFPDQPLIDGLSRAGNLYNWYATIDERGLCPVGFIVPSYNDWEILINAYGGLENASASLKASENDNPSWNGTNESGLSVVNGGWRRNNGEFVQYESIGVFWTTTTVQAGQAVPIEVYGVSQSIVTSDNPFNDGFSVRCLKEPILGCTESEACNFDPTAASDDGSCEYAENGYDCDGVCLNDADGDGVCDEFEIVGCQDPLACDYIADATDEGDCDYTCCPGPGCCDTGTAWDYEIEKCVPINSCPEDLNYDGIIGVEDLLTLLSSFGTPCDPPVAVWTCGDPVSYHSYDYETVLIGEQCWFAENLRTELYLNGDEIPGNLNDDDWINTNEGAQAIYGNDSVNLEFHGRLYNWHATSDQRMICPSQWHVPANVEWDELQIFLFAQGYTGSSGYVLKATEGWFADGNGIDLYGFNALPSGSRSYASGQYNWMGEYTRYWTSSTSNDAVYRRSLGYDSEALLEYDGNPSTGASIRCIKD